MVVQLLDADTAAEALKNPGIIGILISLKGTGITKEQLAEALVSIISLSPSVPVGGFADQRYTRFCKNFGLPDTLGTIAAWDKIKDTSIEDVRLSLRARKAFWKYFQENNIEHGDGLVAVCLLSRAKFLEMKHIGPQTITELESELSRISGLTLVWK